MEGHFCDSKGKKRKNRFRFWSKEQKLAWWRHVWERILNGLQNQIIL